ncbi:MAG: hypothetical protein HY914_03675 [Desulfomonile tiedjei]|nr:hypothetical protein [Desulfomonile tiedjei]
MTEDNTIDHRRDADDPAAKAEVQPEVLPEPDGPVPFVYKVIAFAILALPWSFLLSQVQELLEEQQYGYLSRVSLLVGIVAFLLLVGALAKRLYRFHKGMSRS